MRPFHFLTALLLCGPLLAQVEKVLQDSRHGWYISPHGTIRVLVIFAEIEWDVNPSRDPQPEGARHWPKGQLPTWKNDVFDPYPLPLPKAMVSRYYHDISFGQYKVLGDYLDRVVTIRESEHGDLGNGHSMSRPAVEAANKLGTLRTANGFSVSDFDLWKRRGRAGLPKEPGPDDPHSYDHVMVILRNSTLGHGRGSVDQGSSGRLFGYECDTQSRFGGMNALPFEILKHEFNHMLVGGNNFHSGGGNSPSFVSHFICLQGGWGIMGAGASSLLSCNGWDRDRMGWLPEGATHRVRARDLAGREVNADLDPLAGDTGLFVLRDFVTSGDALRIRMPFIPDDEFPQWIWVENHQGYPRNGSPTDRFHWEDAGDCIDPIQPGLFMFMQVGRDERVGSNIYGGHADHLRPIPANGSFDFYLRGDTLRDDCPFRGSSAIYVRDPKLANPLTGNHEQELVVHDPKRTGKLQRSVHYEPRARAARGGGVEADAVFYGRPEHAFRMHGTRKLGMGTNPSSANMTTLVSSNTRDTHQRGKPNVRAVYLNGISVEMLDMAANGDVTVRVATGDSRIEEHVRWCGDSIVLNPLQGPGGHSLQLMPGRRMLLDRSRTPTRIDAPEEAHGRTWFSAPTRFTVEQGARMRLERKSTLHMVHGSELHLMPGATLDLDPKARLRIDRGSRIVVGAGSTLNGKASVLRKARRQGRIVDAQAGQ